MSKNAWEIELANILDTYNLEVAKVVDATAKSVANKAARTLRATSPQAAEKHRHKTVYAKGWSVKSEKAKGRGYVVHNKTDYQRTHLLERGHVVRNQYGTWGRAPARRHIEPVARITEAEFERRVREAIEHI